VFIFLLILYLVALSVGIGLLIIALLTYEKLQLKAFREASFAASSAILLLLVDAIRTSVVALRLEFNPALRFFCLILAVLGSGSLAYAIPAISFRVVSVAVTRLRWVLHAAIIAIFVGIAYWKETSDVSLAAVVNLAGIGAVHIYGAAVVIYFFKRIVEQPVRYLLRAILVLVAVLETLLAGEIVLTVSVATISEGLRGIPLFQLVYLMSSCGVILFFAFKYMFKPTLSTDCELPLDFITRYGVSGRECEIISLVIQGHSHKQIGDKLFISSRTVKNHIYNIYQKTDVANKVQLMNRIRSSAVV
jgi:DNA-binding CsgD family transcriptional regulator